MKNLKDLLEAVDADYKAVCDDIDKIMKLCKNKNNFETSIDPSTKNPVGWSYVWKDSDDLPALCKYMDSRTSELHFSVNDWFGWHISVSFRIKGGNREYVYAKIPCPEGIDEALKYIRKAMNKPEKFKELVEKHNEL